MRKKITIITRDKRIRCKVGHSFRIKSLASLDEGVRMDTINELNLHPCRAGIQNEGESESITPVDLIRIIFRII